MNQHFRIALLVEGEEEEDYWRRLQNLGLILDEKRLAVINAKSINKIPAKFHENMHQAGITPFLFSAIPIMAMPR